MIPNRRLLFLGVMVVLFAISVSATIVDAQAGEEAISTSILEELQNLYELTLEHLIITVGGLIAAIASIWLSSNGTRKIVQSNETSTNETLKAVNEATNDTIKALQLETNRVLQSTVREVVKTSIDNSERMSTKIDKSFKKNAVLQSVISSKNRPINADEVLKSVREVEDFFDKTKITDFQERFKDKIVSEIMTQNVITIKEDLPLADFFEKCVKIHQKSGYPVVDSNNHLVGIMSTMKDFCVVDREDWTKKTVGDIMKRGLVLTAPTESVINAMKKMKDHDVGRLPVVEANTLVGIVSRQNINILIEELVD